MADVLFEVDDDMMRKLANIANGQGLSLEDYVRQLIVAEARRDPGDAIDAASS